VQEVIYLKQGISSSKKRNGTTNLVYGGGIVDVVESAYVDEVAEFSLRRRIPTSCSLMRDVEVAVDVAIA
jgi:hypothetical protein